MSMSQDYLAAKSQKLHGIVDRLMAIVADGVQQQTPIHEIELQAFRALLEAGRMTAQLFIDCLGDGDQGTEYETPEGKTLQRSSSAQTRPYVSVFGPLRIERYVYAQREGQKIEFAEVDARLALPESKFSYLLQDWDQNSAMEQPFAKVSDSVARILGLRQHVDSLERMNRENSEWVSDFQAEQAAPPAAEEGEIFVQTADGKGVPIRRPADAAPIEDHQHRPGPKPDRKKMATVAAVYSVDRFVRTPEEVVESLFRDPQQERPRRQRPRPRHKRMRAMLNHTDAGIEIPGRVVVYGWMADELANRRKQGNADRPIVNVMDGEQELWDMREEFQPDVPTIDVLDLLHVTPRLWDAASLFDARDSRDAKRFVRDRVLRILRGEVAGVTRGLRRMGTTQLSAKGRRQLEKICNYFDNNRERMRYDEYLRAGYPIASGVIEGACRHVVKDRLERTGMSWVPEGAQAMLYLRCIHLTGDWDAYCAYRVERETKHLYPYRDTLPTINWPIAA